jgi:hypothetical protein
MLPMKEAMSLPMSGKINFEFDLELPNQKLKSGKVGPNWEKAVGGAMFECPANCVFGDGKTKLKPKLKNNRNQAFAEGGIEFGKLNIDRLLAKIDISKGQLAVKKFEAKSEDGELNVDFAMTLAQNIDDSMVTGCLRFTGSQTLLKRDARTHAAISTTGAPFGPDNLYHIRLDGKVKEMKRLGQLCGPGISDKDIDAPGGTSARPNLTIQPDPPPTPAPPAADAASTPPADAGVTVPVPGPGSGDVGSAGSAVPPPPGVPAAGEPPTSPPPPPEGGR